MIKKLRNQPYAPKWEQAPKCEQRRRKKCPVVLCKEILELQLLCYGKVRGQEHLAEAAVNSAANRGRRKETLSITIPSGNLAKAATSTA
jgi:hypothetical protein